MKEWLQNFQAEIRALPPTRLAALAATAAGSLALLLWLALGVSRGEERLLFRDLADDEASRVVEALRVEKIPYRLGDGGGSVYVPAAQVYEARIRLAGKGLPAGGSPGFEVFDRLGFGVTDFVNRVNYQRALQGELARSVEQLEAVERARVQIALAERRGFVGSRSEGPSASVVVRVRPGRELGGAQAAGIVHLVASSVEGLDPSRVTVVDTHGRILNTAPETASGPAPAGALRHQGQVEEDLARRVVEILEPTVGEGGVVARVAARLDWVQTESTEERYDPDSQVARSEETVQESSSDGSDLAQGIPGVASNSPEGQGGAAVGASSARSERSTETVNYEISKVVSRTVAPVGTVQRLDVAVLVDGRPTEDGSFQAWDAESLQRFEELAQRAVGFSAERGDRITVSSAPFRTIEVEEGPAEWLQPEIVLLATGLLRVLGLLGALWIVARLVVKPLLAGSGRAAGLAFPARAAEAEIQLAGAGAGVALEGAGGVAAAARPGPGTLAGVASGASERPPAAGASEEAVKALRLWLSER